jgi:hypothetical protein
MVRPIGAEWDLLARISWLSSPLTATVSAQQVSPMEGKAPFHLDLSLRKIFSLENKSRPIEAGRLLAEVLELLIVVVAPSLHGVGTTQGSSPRF